MTSESLERLERLCKPWCSILMEKEKHDIRDLIAENECLKEHKRQSAEIIAGRGDKVPRYAGYIPGGGR